MAQQEATALSPQNGRSTSKMSAHGRTLQTNFLWIGIGFAVLYWFLESSVHVFLFQEGQMFKQVFHPNPHEIWMRIIVGSLLIIISLYAQSKINERRRSEQALQQSQRELAQILENNPAGIMLVDIQSRRISWANSNALQMVGMDKDSIEGHICHKFMCPSEKEKCPVLDLGEQFDSSERRLRTAAGFNLPILKSVRKVSFKGREHLLEAFFDITERKQMERQVKMAHAELERIFQTASVGMRLIDKNFNILKVNSTFEEMAGVSKALAVGRKCYEVFAGETCHSDQCALRQILCGEHSVECEIEKQPRDGTVINCLLTANRFEAPDGELLGIVESFKNITDLKRVQEELRLERDKLRRVLYHQFEGVGIVNSDFIIEYQNETFKELFGDHKGQCCHTSYKNSPLPCQPCLMRMAIDSGVMQRSEFGSASGRAFEQTYAPFEDVDGQKKVVVVLRDITERKTSVAAAVRSEQLAAIGELAAGVAHEINNPINGIINYAQILVNKFQQEDMVSDIAQRMLKEGDRIATIVESLLSFARPDKESKTRVEVQRLLADSLGLTAAQLRKDAIVLKKDIAAELPMVLAQPQKIQQVFLNLISNARYALNERFPSPHNNKVLEVRAAGIQLEGERYVSVTFFDQGSGIPKDLLEKIRNPFFSTKPSGEGTGLGLSISHGIVEDHGGQLTIDSVKGRFTRVMVALPVNGKTTAAEEKAHA